MAGYSGSAIWPIFVAGIFQLPEERHNRFGLLELTLYEESRWGRFTRPPASKFGTKQSLLAQFQLTDSDSNLARQRARFRQSRRMIGADVAEPRT